MRLEAMAFPAENRAILKGGFPAKAIRLNVVIFWQADDAKAAFLAMRLAVLLASFVSGQLDLDGELTPHLTHPLNKNEILGFLLQRLKANVSAQKIPRIQQH